jgi:hypothetical protein
MILNLSYKALAGTTGGVLAILPPQPSNEKELYGR